MTVMDMTGCLESIGCVIRKNTWNMQMGMFVLQSDQIKHGASKHDIAHHHRAYALNLKRHRIPLSSLQICEV